VALAPGAGRTGQIRQETSGFQGFVRLAELARALAFATPVLSNTRYVCVPVLLGVLTLSACSGKPSQSAANTSSAAPAQATTPPAATPPSPAPASSGPPGEAPLPPPEYESGIPEEVRGLLTRPFTGDLDEMVKRRLIRVGVTYNRTLYYVDKGVQRGVAYEHLRNFEEVLNKKYKTGNLRIHLVFVPLSRDVLLQSLAEGKVDLATAQLTVTPERRALVDFTNPTRRNISEVVVTGPGSPVINSEHDLSGKQVFVRKSSSYYQSLLALNTRLESQKLAPVTLQEAPENLEDDDLLEMVNAGLIKIIVVDNYLAAFWAKVFPHLRIHENVALRTGGELAVALRKNSPKLAAETNEYIAKYGLGSAFGNVIEKRYLQSTALAKDATSQAERKKFQAVVELFKKYGDKYDLDFLLMAAQGFQESGLDQNVKSKVGAIGVMQVMPATGKELNVGDVRQIEPNIHAGVKYVRFMVDQYFKDEPMDRLNKGLFAFASYNAGPARIRQLRAETARRGLNPNVWFGNVERIVSERIGRETVTYVSNIYKYYIAYRLLLEERDRRAAEKSKLGAK
jgi:membrane-bound lytic murein transglycosylase MltF